MISVTANNSDYRYGDPSALTLSAAGASGTIQWSTTSGSLSAATGSSNTLTPSNQTDIVRVTVTDSANGDTAYVDIQIWGTLPGLQPKWGMESDLDEPLTRWEMAYEQRNSDEYEAMLQFFDWHKKASFELSESEDGSLSVRLLQGIPFYVNHIALGELTKVYFDSSLRRSKFLIDWVNYSFQLVSFEFAVRDTPTTGPFVEVLTTDADVPITTDTGAEIHV